jgi:hypothetical protein
MPVLNVELAGRVRVVVENGHVCSTASVGVGTETYRARTGRFVAKLNKGPEGKREQSASESKLWFGGPVIMVLLVTGGFELNPGQQVEITEINQITSYVKTREKESKAIKGLLEGHKQEMAKMKKGTKALGSKFDELNEVIRDYDQMKQTVID